VDQFINPIERSLLHDLSGLYACDLETDSHTHGHGQCLVCAKQAIIVAITRYEELDALYRERAAVSVASLVATASL
jgi:hypothetical protein